MINQVKDDGRMNVCDWIEDFHIGNSGNIALSLIRFHLRRFAKLMMPAIKEIPGSPEKLDEAATILLGGLKNASPVTKIMILISCMMHTLDQLKKDGP